MRASDKRLLGLIHYQPGFWRADKAEEVFEQLMQQTPWQQPSITMYGKTQPVPRLTTWFGDEGASYRYSGIQHAPLPWTPLLSKLKTELEAETGGRFNSVLLNLYRHGQDSNGWHADNEAELDAASPIVSASFGATRRFRMRMGKDNASSRHIDLEHGSLLVMAPGAQAKMQHCVPKTARPVKPRINLTFRRISR